MFDKLDIPILGLIENMSLFFCPNCGHESHIFGHNGAKDTAKNRDIPYLGGIPLDIDIRLCADNGTPVVLEHPDSPAAKAFFDIAHNLSETLLQKAA
jgi:ATP-binding protein involved in chromosome partitioning